MSSAHETSNDQRAYTSKVYACPLLRRGFSSVTQALGRIVLRIGTWAHLIFESTFRLVVSRWLFSR